VLVDTLGLIWGLAVLPAAPTDWDGAVEVFKRVGKTLPRLARVWADSNYQARALADWIAAHAGWVLDIVLKRPGQTTFEVQKWRWVVEIVHSQMTKPDVLALGAGREDVVDLDLVVGHDDAIDQQLDQLPPPAEGRVLKPRRDPLAERPHRGGETGRPVEPFGLTG
jgi:hypothetical protein